MTRSARTLFALAVLCAAHPGLAAPTHADIQAVAERQLCESTGVTRIVFAGYSSQLAEAAIEDLARQTIEQLHADLEAHIPVQDEFARATLACDDWLDMWPHFGNQAPPEGVLWILVTPEMAGRCLKSTKIEAFWAPEAQEAFESKLGFFRARK